VCTCILFPQDLDSSQVTSLSYSRLKCLTAQLLHCCFARQQLTVVSQCCKGFALFKYSIIVYFICYFLNFDHKQSEPIYAATQQCYKKNKKKNIWLSVFSYSTPRVGPMKEFTSRHNKNNLRMCENQKYVSSVVQSSD